MSEPNIKKIISRTLSEMDAKLSRPPADLPESIIKTKTQTSMKLNKERNYNFEVIRDLFELSIYHVIISEKGAFIDQSVLTVKAPDPFAAVVKAVGELQQKSKKVNKWQ